MADLLVSGLVFGSIITLGAIGLTLMSDILGFFNFAYGEYFTLGAYISFLFLQILPNMGHFKGLSFGSSMILAVFISVGITIIVILLVDYLFFKPLRKMGVSSLFMALASLGISFIIRASINIIWGPKVRYYSTAIQISKELPFGIHLKMEELVIIISTVVLVVSVFLFLKRTKMGKAMRAVSDNTTLAMASGVDSNNVIMWTWIISGGLAAIAGTFYGIQVQLRPTMGWEFLIPLFVAVIMGGIGNFWGALVGGMIIGISEELITGLIQNLLNSMSITTDVSVYKPAVAFVFVIIILLFKPYGIFARKEG
ncbi:MAG: branched-chain amino acid ABC transporter permease [Spirochaetes bacterium]|nr:MAG: branched-chain amino acid ABC transporter permease [Spirochaetota bacterium]